MIEGDKSQYDHCGKPIHVRVLWGSACEVAERLRPGDGERKTLLTRQIAFEPLPASVLFGLLWFLSFKLFSVVFEFCQQLLPPS
jgi:hypothetical protein